MMASFHRIKSASRRFHQLFIVLLFYWFMATAYYLTILYNVQAAIKPGESVWSGESYTRILLDYGLKLLLTLPIWLLIFRVLRDLRLWKRTPGAPFHVAPLYHCLESRLLFSL